MRGLCSNCEKLVSYSKASNFRKHVIRCGESPERSSEIITCGNCFMRIRKDRKTSHICMRHEPSPTAAKYKLTDPTGDLKEVLCESFLWWVDRLTSVSKIPTFFFSCSWPFTTVWSWVPFEASHHRTISSTLPISRFSKSSGFPDLWSTKWFWANWTNAEAKVQEGRKWTRINFPQGNWHIWWKWQVLDWFSRRFYKTKF